MNNLIQRLISRPILTISLSILLLLLGIIGLTRLPLRLLPYMTLATIQVKTVYPGAAPADVEAFVTNKIQSSLVGVDGIDYITASSAQGESDINAVLMPGQDPNVVMTAILEKVQSIVSLLPTGTLPPQVAVQDSNNMSVMFLSVTSSQWSRLQVADYLRRVVEPTLESIDGVSQAQVLGDQYAMQIWVNPLTLLKYQLTPQDLFNALKTQNVLAMPGNTEGKTLNYNLSATTSLTTAQQFNDAIIKTVNGYPIRIRDIGEAQIGSRDDVYSVYFNQQQTTMIRVMALPTGNPLAIAKTIIQKLPDIQKNHPSAIIRKE